ncbi:PREDICTED: melatonin receptor type 1B-like [Branchiostoma belcheri]|uniref:Melatonin receptor type 1B-like n=1 Tax=Branchiostoma belcheri TaxID=7741 RepID=A0A6P4XWY9_BRABE|nr:PREDICTED: melatonin receptor type 1B-like [Branchiostoma belcheri]
MSIDSFNFSNSTVSTITTKPTTIMDHPSNVTIQNEEFDEHAFQVSILSVMAVVGTVGNSVVLGLLLTVCRGDTTATPFVISLTVADLVVSLVIDSFHIKGILDSQFFIEHGIVCRAVGSLCVAGCIASLATAAAISVNRYMCVCKRALHDAVFTDRGNALIVATVWVYGALYVIPLWAGYGGVRYDLKTKNCMYDRTNVVFTLIFIIVGHLVPTVAVFAANAKLFLYVRDVKGKVTSPAVRQKLFHEELKVFRSLGILCVYFVLSWLQYAVIVVSDTGDVWPPAAHFLSLVIAHTSSSINAVLFAATNGNMKRKVKKLCGFTRCNPKHGTRVTTDQLNTFHLRRIHGQGNRPYGVTV